MTNRQRRTLPLNPAFQKTCDGASDARLPRWVNRVVVGTSGVGARPRERAPSRKHRIQEPDPGTPIEGREVIAAIFAQSSSTRGSGAYTAEFKLDGRTTFLRWEGTMDGHKIESLEVIVDNEQGLIVERTIALRPYPAVKLFRDAMYASLKDKLPPDVWDYATP